MEAERKLEEKYIQFMLGAQTDLYRFLTAECCKKKNYRTFGKHLTA